MNAITKLDVKLTNELHAEALALLLPLQEKYGIKIRTAGGGYDVDKAVLKFEFRLQGEDAEKIAFAQHCIHYGCKPTDYGASAVLMGDVVKLIGFDISRSAYPVRVRNAKGQVQCFRRDVLATKFKIGGAL